MEEERGKEDQRFKGYEKGELPGLKYVCIIIIVVIIVAVIYLIMNPFGNKFGTNSTKITTTTTKRPIYQFG